MKKQDSQGYFRYLAKNLVYMHSPTFDSFNSTATSKEPWLKPIKMAFFKANS